MSHVCFVTDELYPVTGGGAGTLIHNSARLLDARGHSVSVLLDVDHGLEEAQVWWREHRAAHGIRALYGVTDLTRNQPIPTDEEFTQWYNWRSYRAYLALREICGSVRVDLVEFNDFLDRFKDSALILAPVTVLDYLPEVAMLSLRRLFVDANVPGPGKSGLGSAARPTPTTRTRPPARLAAPAWKRNSWR